MRLRISLSDLLLLIMPTIAIVLGLITAAANADSPTYVLTVAQAVYLAAMFIALCALFHRRRSVQTFAAGFLAASLGHLLVVRLAGDHAYAFPTTVAFGTLWDAVRPDESLYAQGMAYEGASWISYPPMGGVSGYGGMGTGGVALFSGIGGGTFEIPVGRRSFIGVGTWSLSLILGVVCGIVARCLRGDEKLNVERQSTS